jgi:hypothetical protein
MSVSGVDLWGGQVEDDRQAHERDGLQLPGNSPSVATDRAVLPLCGAVCVQQRLTGFEPVL